MVPASGSPKTVEASSNDTPCLARFASAFFGSHSKLHSVIIRRSSLVPTRHLARCRPNGLALTRERRSQSFESARCPAPLVGCSGCWAALVGYLGSTSGSTRPTASSVAKSSSASSSTVSARIRVCERRFRNRTHLKREGYGVGSKCTVGRGDECGARQLGTVEIRGEGNHQNGLEQPSQRVALPHDDGTSASLLL